ncbi:putative glycoside hydrolase, family 5, glycoside hydrolase superfamily [Plasmopara halstedii]
MWLSFAVLAAAVVTHVAYGFMRTLRNNIHSFYYVRLIMLLFRTECRQPNYLAKGGKIFAVDPNDESIQTEIRIKGVTWGGMETIDMIPDGLWGTESPNSMGTQATTISKLQDFLDSNGFNSIRLSLNADYVIKNPDPQLTYIHAFENPELTTWEDPENVDYINFLARVVETLQDRKLTVLLDIHRLTKYETDAFWYTNPYVDVRKSGTYKAVTILAEKLCGARFWNVIGIDLKDEMMRAHWEADPADSDETTDWHNAAGILANAVLQRCPQWLIFVGGASSYTDAQRFRVNEKYGLSTHWNGGNLKNATLNPLQVNTRNKIVYAPHAHAHGVEPKNYFYEPSSNCTNDIEQFESLDLTADQKETRCVDFINGTETKSKLPCRDSQVACSMYEHISIQATLRNYEAVMTEALGNLPQNPDISLVLGAFSGVYGKAQPHQTAVLEYLIDFAASVQGGYFYALNPNTQLYLEDSEDGEGGTFAVTHYGLMQTSSWQEPYNDLLEALTQIPSSAIPCYGGTETNAAASPLRDAALVIGNIVIAIAF